MTFGLLARYSSAVGAREPARFRRVLGEAPARVRALAPLANGDEADVDQHVLGEAAAGATK